MFLKFWTKHGEFKKVTKEAWNVDEIIRSPFIMMHIKMKNVRRTLAQWSRKTFGDTFIRIATSEDMIKVNEI